MSDDGRVRVTVGSGVVWHSQTTTSTALCPDLLSLDDLGAADNLRGRVVRGFFRLITWWH